MTARFNVDDLVEQGLVKKKTYTEGQYKGLSVLKYSRKVFFDNLWNLDPRLLWCRGTVVDENHNVISLPFKKVFNWKENNTTVDPDKTVRVVQKLNGFLAVVTSTEDYGLLVSTTGTLDSDYAKLARSYIEKLDTQYFLKSNTYMFEICDPSDPHIVPEEAGAYLIGSNVTDYGIAEEEHTLDFTAELLNAKRPKHSLMTFQALVEEELPTCKHEGFMVKGAFEEETLCKIKSNYYLSKKMLQRCGKNKANAMWKDSTNFKLKLDEEFYEIFDLILDTFTREEYLILTEQERSSWIQDYFDKKQSI